MGVFSPPFAQGQKEIEAEGRAVDFPVCLVVFVPVFFPAKTQARCCIVAQ
jgi:hypothetical protein